MKFIVWFAVMLVAAMGLVCYVRAVGSAENECSRHGGHLEKAYRGDDLIIRCVSGDGKEIHLP